jgi:hypothetical protein
MKTKRFKLTAVFSREAQDIVEERSLTAMKRNKAFTRGHEWKEKSFKTEAEMQAYIDGLDDGNGWTSEVYWVKHLPKGYKPE